MKRKLFTLLLLIFVGVALFTIVAICGDVPTMTKDELKAMLGNSDLVILDVRLASDYMSSDLKVKGAVREYGDIGTWVYKYPKDKTLVLYCASPQEGKSTPVAQNVLQKGFTKVYVLKGGWEEWLNANYPTEKK